MKVLKPISTTLHIHSLQFSRRVVAIAIQTLTSPLFCTYIVVNYEPKYFRRIYITAKFNFKSRTYSENEFIFLDYNINLLCSVTQCIAQAMRIGAAVSRQQRLAAAPCTGSVSVVLRMCTRTGNIIKQHPCPGAPVVRIRNLTRLS